MFEFVDRPEPGTAKPRLKEGDSEGDEGHGDRGGFGDNGIEDDWADPLVLDSIPVPGRGKESLKDATPSPPSPSNVPPLAKSRPATSGSSKSLPTKINLIFDSESENQVQEGAAGPRSWSRHPD